MNRRLKVALAAAPCMVVMASAAFAQTNMAAPPAPDPNMAGSTAMGAPMSTGAMSATTTTTTTTAAARHHRRRGYIHQTGGEPVLFVLAGSLLSGSMLFVRRRFGK